MVVLVDSVDATPSPLSGNYVQDASFENQRQNFTPRGSGVVFIIISRRDDGRFARVESF